MQNLIKKLKALKKIGAVGIKQSLEDEGASFQDIITMRKITLSAKLDLNIKIGGCEAKNDIFFCRKNSVNAIVAPMVESEYALNKFIQTVSGNKKNSLFVNLESKTAFKNINKIVNSKKFKFLKGVVIGRSDLAGSYGLTKDHVDSKKIYNEVIKVLRKIKKNKKIVKMGGSITPKSKEFIKLLHQKKLLDRVETRNVEILLNKKTINNFENIIRQIFSFELDWIKYKFNNSKIRKSKLEELEYTNRIKEIEKRIKKFILTK